MLLFSCNNQRQSSENENQKETINKDSIDKPVHQPEKKEEANQSDTFSISEITDETIISGHEVLEVMYQPKDEFILNLKGDWEIHGAFVYNEMWSEIYFQPKEELYQNVIIDYEGLQKPLITYFRLSNQAKLKNFLTTEELKRIQNGETLEAQVKVANYAVAGKFDGYGEASAELIKVLEK